MSERNEPSINIGGISITVSDWEAIPAIVKTALVSALIANISRLEERGSHLEEQLNQNS